MENVDKNMVVAKETEHFSWHRLLVTVLIVVVTAGVVFGITWFILDKMTREDQEASDKLRVVLQQQIDSLRAKVKSGATSTSDVSTVGWLTYKDSTYGYSFMYPISGYAVANATAVKPVLHAQTINLTTANYNSENSAIAYVAYYSKSASTDLKTWITNGNVTQLNYLGSLKTVTVAGKSGYSFNSGGLNGETSYAVVDSKGNVVVLTTILPEDTNFEAILGSLKTS